MNLQRDMERDRQYWGDIARQRGGEEVFFQWSPSLSNGSNVMGARIICTGPSVAPQG